MLRNLSIVLCTIVLFQSVVIAPAINVSLSVEAAATFLRFIWPIFFFLVGVLSLIGLLLSRNSKHGRAVNLLTLACMFVNWLLVPVINSAMDADDMNTWAALHITTVGLTLLSLVFHLIFILRWSKSP